MGDSVFRWTQDKRGTTVVLVAFLLVGLFGMLAIAVDVARLIVSRNQMQLAADSGALAAAVSVLQGDTLGAPDSAVVYALANYADTAAMLEDSAVVFGVWDPDSSEFEPRAVPWNTNAIRVRTAQSSTNLVAWILGSQLSGARAQAYAVFAAAVSETTCEKPLAVGRGLIDTDNDGVITEEERILALGTTFVIKPAESPSDAPSFYYAVVLPPYYDASTGSYSFLDDSTIGAGAYRKNIATCNPDLVGVGDSLLTKPGANFGPTNQGFRDLCGQIDALGTCNPTGAYSPDGLPGIPILAPLWDARVNPIGRAAVEVTDIAAFRVTFIHTVAARVKVEGRFIRMVDGGAAAPGVGLVERPILVR
jgi:Flp pilus assembly protein TadG